ncbi:hypothetical protein Kpol_1015p5 [Vanderwaltozyma polyspora DSM 70294]|uniref:Protein BNI4 n=1 Tax=Vanderwaltozyma polyspora (strain ATCC 22028 / DSM 70294 / BCRC 21397 / CBS 2163 / NBRC 10782 / NRRL Y-8283 / UCD 57-17) TaxID=436907 RepID=A7TQN5_VANPO|nr:uncharacterized protein Kpol_1015p5 [Vanderwaltozyma polyspora DSM 70294]EDO15416.1 hypothetical protein Kpol_1015p5 [Vanderwaltozyma polyspora DSM 70294]
MNGFGEEAQDVWNSSFYSSNSIDTVEHAKNFRNSLILEELPNDINELIRDDDDSIQEISQNDAIVEDENNETMTINMTTSPSLSALAGILNEKSKQADRRMRSSMIVSNSIEEALNEEAEEDENTVNVLSKEPTSIKINSGIQESQQTKEQLAVIGKPVIFNKHILNTQASDSPNLIDIYDSNKKFPLSTYSVSSVTEQPDFLSSPNPAIQNKNQSIIGSMNLMNTGKLIEREKINEVPSSEVEHSEFSQSSMDDKLAKKNVIATSNSRQPQDPEQPNKRQMDQQMKQNQEPKPELQQQKSKPRSISTQSISSERSMRSQGTQSSKRKSIFSFLKRKTSRQDQDVNDGLPTSTTFSVGSTKSRMEPTLLTTKSQSSSSIFSSFRKNKDPKPTQRVILNKKDSSSINTDNSVRLKESNKISQRKPTPLGLERRIIENPVDSHVEGKKEIHTIVTSDEDSVEEGYSSEENDSLEEKEKIYQNNLNTGVSLFPKSLDSHEVESIVSLERNRSIKSNSKKSHTHRRSLSEALSINAQNEGMFISDATSVVLSTPDLTKSPASSILRNGRFSTGDASPNLLNFDDDFSENGMTSGSSQLINPIESNFSLGSIQEHLDSLTIDSDNERIDYESQKEVKLGEPIADDELMSDIMEFANIIDFGENINFDLDLDVENKEPIGNNVVEDIEVVENAEKNQPVITIEDNGEIIDESLKTSTIGKSQLDNYQYSSTVDISDSEDVFENEDFNNITSNGKVNAYLPEAQNNRPISMSFRGLNAPSFNIPSYSAIEGNKSPTISVVTPITDHSNKPRCRLQFSSKIILYETYSEEEYDRHPDLAACNQLTPQLAQMIKIELNELKSEMDVHEDSRCYTHFY